MSDGLKLFIGIITIILLIYATIVSNNKDEAFEEGYKAACTDFYKGKLKLQLVELEDGSITWKKLK